MSQLYLVSTSGANPLTDPSMVQRLGIFDAALQKNPYDEKIIGQALSFLEDHSREDLLMLWANRACSASPHSQLGLFAMANAQEHTGRFDLAVPLWVELSHIAPTLDPLHLRLGLALVALAKLDEALTICEAAEMVLAQNLSLTSQIYTRDVYRDRFNVLRSEIFLRRGQPQGFHLQLAQLAFRMPCFQWPNLPWWNGEIAAHTHLLVTPVGGYGDQLLYAALLPELHQLGLRITVAVHDDLVSLMQNSLPGIRVVATSMPTSLAANPPESLVQALHNDMPDAQTTMLHLPKIRTQRAPQRSTFPAYLSPPTTRDDGQALWRAQLKARALDRKVVGITWDRAQRYFPEIVGGVEACRTARTSLPGEQLLALVEDERLAQFVHFVALHEDDATRSWPAPLPNNLSNLHISGGDFAHTAAVIDTCDLVLSVDMSVANLAALSRTQTWLMLAFEGDWRWGNDAAQSPWLPTVRLFRQSAPGDWASVTTQVRCALEAWFASC